MSGKRIRADELIEIFEDILEEPGGVKADSNFFAIGGDSLLATRVISRLRRDYALDLTFAEFSQAPTPRALQDLVAELDDATSR